MPGSRVRDLLLLALSAALLAFGGGVGCDPVLAGVDFRPANVPFDPDAEESPPDWYMAFTGKKAPGDGFAELPYAVTPPFGVEARLGVHDEERLAASVDAEVCIGFAEVGGAGSTRVCVSPRSGPARSVVSTNLGDETKECLDETTVDIEIDDDGVTTSVRVRCPGQSEVALVSVPSAFAPGERWHLFFEAAGLAPGGQLGFDNLEIANLQPVGSQNETPTSLVFDALLLNLEAFDRIEHDVAGAASLAGQAEGIAILALNKAVDGTAQDKLIAKGLKTRTKLVASIGAKYLKGFPKLAALDADSLEAGAAAP